MGQSMSKLVIKLSKTSFNRRRRGRPDAAKIGGGNDYWCTEENTYTITLQTPKLAAADFGPPRVGGSRDAYFWRERGRHDLLGDGLEPSSCDTKEMRDERDEQERVAISWRYFMSYFI